MANYIPNGLQPVPAIIFNENQDKCIAYQDDVVKFVHRPASAAPIESLVWDAAGNISIPSIADLGIFAKLAGRAGGQQLYGGVAANEDLLLDGTSHVTKTTSYVLLQSSGGNVGIGTSAPVAKLAINGGVHIGGDSDPGDNNLLVDGTIQVPDAGKLIIGTDSSFRGEITYDGTTDADLIISNTFANAIGDIIFKVQGSTEVMRLTGAGVTKVVGAFACNNATPQTPAASGGALAAYGAGANGLDSGANMAALHALVVAMRAALVANGIMS